MPNILLTYRCVRSCPYCFAKKYMSEHNESEFLSWENLIYIADFFQVAGEKRFSLLGGEPTLHPAFNDIILYLLERDFNINVFTSGIMEGKKLEETVSISKNIPFDRLSFICNINDPEKTSSNLAEIESVKRFLRLLGPRVIPGFNIYRKDFELDFLFGYINEFGLNRSLRVGLAHPIPQENSHFIFIEDIDDIIARLFSYTPMFERFRVKPGLDCGFPLCRIPDNYLSWLYRYTGKKNEFGCGPVIDIGPEMSVWSCFPLSSFNRKSIFDFNSLQDIYQYYMRIHGIVRTEIAGIYEKCDDCVHREDGICNGGCISHSIANFQKEAPIRLKEIYS